MITRIQKNGFYGIAIAIPDDEAEALGLSVGMCVKLARDGDAIKVTKVGNRPTPRPTPVVDDSDWPPPLEGCCEFTIVGPTRSKRLLDYEE